MKKIVIYLIALFFIVIAIGAVLMYGLIDLKVDLVKLGAYCFLFGALGGIVHCIRSVYVHQALMADWDDQWDLWYYLRPVVSGIIGVISMVFIKAGLLVFSAETEFRDNKLIYAAVAFLAGYNVKNFLSKIEDVSKATLGIEKKSFPEKKDNI